MEIIKKRVTINELNFTILLSQDEKNLGLLEDASDNVDSTTIQSVINNDIQLSGTCESKLQTVRSYDYTNPYIVGVNGVLEVSDQFIKYQIDDITYTTNLTNNDTIFVITKLNDTEVDHHFIRIDNTIGLADKIIVNDNVEIERPNLSVIESFSKLQQIGTPDELYSFGNNFYKVYNETL